MKVHLFDFTCQYTFSQTLVQFFGWQRRHHFISMITLTSIYNTKTPHALVRSGSWVPSSGARVPASVVPVLRSPTPRTRRPAPKGRRPAPKAPSVPLFQLIISFLFFFFFIIIFILFFIFFFNSVVGLGAGGRRPLTLSIFCISR